MIANLQRATLYALQGLVAAFRHERAFRQEILLAVFLVPAAFWIGHNSLEISLLVGVVLLVLIAELLNSAIEACIDRISPELHELSQRAKDLGSAAVLIALILCVVVWAGVLFQ